MRSPAPTSSSASRSRGRSPRRAFARWPTARSSSRWPTRRPRCCPRRSLDDVAVIGTGRSDYPNQVNNVLAFPGIFRGALDVRASRDHGGDEARGREGDRGRDPAGGARARLRDPEHVQPRSRPGGRRGGRPGGRGGRRRPPEPRLEPVPGPRRGAAPATAAAGLASSGSRESVASACASSCLTRSRVRPSWRPISWSVCGSPDEAEVALEDHPLALGEGLQRAADDPAALALLELVLRGSRRAGRAAGRRARSARRRVPNVWFSESVVRARPVRLVHPLRR